MKNDREKIALTGERTPDQNKRQRVQHQSGTIPSFVYYSLSSIKPFNTFISDVKKLIKQKTENFQIGGGVTAGNQPSLFSQFCDQQQFSNLHISVSKVFRIYLKQKQVFLNALKKQVTNSCGSNSIIPISFNKITILQKKFIVLQIENGVFKQKLQKVTETVNRVLQKWKIDPYNSDPIFHATLYRINQQKLIEQIKNRRNRRVQIENEGNQKPGDTKQQDQQEIRNTMNQMIDEISSELEWIVLKKICFNCKDLCLKTGVKISKLT